MPRHPTGSPVFDDLLDGGYEKGIITLIYGPAGSGKSNLMLLSLVNIDKRAIFIDTEGSFSVDRLSQLTPNVEELLDRVILLQAHSFEQQTEIINKLPKLVQSDVELVILDGIAHQYRAAMARSEQDLNKSLSQQVHAMQAVAASKNIPILVTSQVYADMERDGVKVVGGDIVKYTAKCMIELQHDDNRTAIVRKHRSLPHNKSRNFVIDSVGIYE